ncbi:inositol monophosphatase family protein [Tengunoibacter tsumagoiensis]|uniref:Inositol monophosphatase n=1 Tax=Tengunoibacter tsumagoiensis TaxID=2014871 RepID=A0A402A1P6_9CHLR|nr:inositol monophosphatase [Tengunoibacter tsumagoiensis]GCE12982.1 inositol monophosphatase [Tengunoibacter tsumagoiensis]
MQELLEQLFRQVRAYAQSERYDRKQVYSQSSKHTTMQFDRDAEDIIIDGLTESGIGFEIISEERETFSTTANPAYRVIIDPIDGSDNVERGIMTASVALAVVPIDAPVTPEHVQWALVGELFSGTVYEAQKGAGAFRNGRRCQTSTITNIRESLAGVNLDGKNIEAMKALLTQSPALKQMRRTGSPAMDSVYVASGTYDAYIDIGDEITGESFLASAGIVLEAGGVVTDQEGKPLRPIANLSEKFSLVLAGNKKLHQEILSRLKKTS